MKPLKSLIQKGNISKMHPGMLFKIDHPTLDDLFTPGNIVITYEQFHSISIVVEYDKIPWLKEFLEDEHIKEKYVLLQMIDSDEDDWAWQDMDHYDSHLCHSEDDIFDVKYILKSTINEKDLIPYEKFKFTFQKYGLDRDSYIISKYC